MPFTKCSVCNYQFIWNNEPHRCKPLFYAISRDEWFGYLDNREINELSQAEFDEIDWYKSFRASSATEAAEKYVEYKCDDERIDSLDIYVKDSQGKITRHTVVSEIVLQTSETDFKEIGFLLPRAGPPVNLAAAPGLRRGGNSNPAGE